MTRKRFLQQLLSGALWITGAGLAGWPILRFLTWREQTIRTVVFAAEELAPFAVKDDVILVPGRDSLQALSARCTHLGCLVRYHDPAKELLCPCHESAYTLQGKRLRGPARSDLALLDSQRLENGDLAIARPIRG